MWRYRFQELKQLSRYIGTPQMNRMVNLPTIRYAGDLRINIVNTIGRVRWYEVMSWMTKYPTSIKVWYTPWKYWQRIALVKENSQNLKYFMEVICLWAAHSSDSVPCMPGHQAFSQDPKRGRPILIQRYIYSKGGGGGGGGVRENVPLEKLWSLRYFMSVSVPSSFEIFQTRLALWFCAAMLLYLTTTFSFSQVHHQIDQNVKCIIIMRIEAISFQKNVRYINILWK